MKSRLFYFGRLLPAATLVSFSGSAHAASQTWKAAPTDANWATATNWAGGAVPGNTTGANVGDITTFNTALFGGILGGTGNPINLGAGSIGIGGIIFDTANAGAYQIGIAGQNLTLSSQNSTGYGSRGIQMTSTVANSQIIAANLLFTAPSSTNGLLGFVNNAALASNTLTLSGSVTNGAARPVIMVLDGSNTGANTFSGNFNITAVTQTTQPGIVKVGQGMWVLSGTNTFSGSNMTNTSGSGGIQVLDGVLQLRNNSALGNIAQVWIGNKSTTSTVNSTGPVTYIATSVNGGTLELANNITLDNGLTLNLFTAGTIRSDGSNTTNAKILLQTTAAVSSTLSTVNSSDVFTVGNGTNDFSGGASDTVVRIAGPGTVLLNNASNYVGKVSMDFGTLRLGSGTALGAATTANVLFGASSTGKLQLNGNSTTVIGLNTNATPGSPVLESGTAGASALTVNNVSANIFAGVLQNGAAGTLSLTKGAAGSLTLSNANTYTGGTTISTGTLVAGNSSALGSGAVSITGATLSATNLTIGALTFGGTGNLALANVASNLVISTGAVTINGTGNLLTVGGTSAAGNIYTLLSGTSFSGSGLSLTGTSVANQLILLGNNTTVGRTNYAFGSTGAALQLTVTGGAFNVTWNGGNAAWNATDLNWQKDGLGSNIAFFTGDNTTISTANSIAVDGAGVTTGTLLVNNSSGAAPLSGGSVTANGAFIKSGAGTLQLDNAVSATAGTTISGGTLALGATGSLSSSAVFVNGGALNIGSTSATLGNVSLTAGSIDGSTGVLTGTGSAYDTQAGSVSAILGGSIGLNKTTGGTVTLSGANTYSGATTVSAGTLALSGSGTFGTGSLTVSGGIADLGSSSITNILGALTGGGAVNNGTITNNAGNHNLQDGSVGAVLAGTNGLNKSTAGTVALTSANIFSGATTITAGVLRMDNSLALQNSTVTVSIANGLAFGTGITNATVGALSGASAFDLTNSDTNAVNLTAGGNTASTTYSGLISGTGSMTKTGTGTFVLGVANSYSGGTNLNAGTLSLANNTAAGSGTITALNGTTLNVSNATTFVVSPIAFSGANANVALTAANLTGGFSSAFTGSADQALTISGAVNLSSNFKQLQGFNGTVAIGSGSSLQFRASSLNNGGDNTLFSVNGFLTSRNGGTVALGALSGSGTVTMGTSGGANQPLTYTIGARGNDTTFSGVVQDGDTIGAKLVNVIKTGSAIQTFSGANTFTGSLAVNQGTLAAALGNNSTNPVSGALGNTQVARSITVNNAGTLRFDAGDVMGGAGSTILSTLVINIGGTVTNNGGQFNTLGAVTLNGGILTGSGGSSNGQFQMYAFGGTVTAGGSSASTISSAVGTANGGTALDTVGYHLGTAVTTGTTFNVADATTSSASDLNVPAILVDRTGGLGAASLTKSGAGTLTLTGINTYTGTTSINGGMLELPATGSLASSAIAISGGTLLLGGGVGDRLNNTGSVTLGNAASDSILQLSNTVSETAGPLSLSAGGAGRRVIDFGNVSGVLNFTSLLTNASTLQVWNWSGNVGTGGGTDQFIVNTTDSFSNVVFYSDSGVSSLGTAAFSTGNPGELVPVPEPGALFGGLALLAPLAWRERRQWMRCREARGPIAG